MQLNYSGGGAFQKKLTLVQSWPFHMTNRLFACFMLAVQSALRFWIHPQNSFAFMPFVLGLRVGSGCIADSHCMIAIPVPSTKHVLSD